MVRTMSNGAILHRCATSRETRSSTILSQNSSSNSQESIPSNSQNKKSHNETLHNLHRSKVSSAPASIAELHGSAESGNEDSEAEASEEDDDDENDDEEEPEGSAPSDKARKKRSYQTGHIRRGRGKMVQATVRKRAWSGSSDDDIELARPAKVAKSIPQSPILVDESDDEDYNAVDLISDSDEEEPTVEKIEERMIIDSEEENDAAFVPRNNKSRASSVSSDGWQGFDLEGSLFLSDMPFFDEQMGRLHADDLASETELYNGNSIIELDHSPSPPPTRRVRFADDDIVPTHDNTTSTNSDADEDVFPDLFLQQDSLDPTFRKLIENDDDEDANSNMDGEGSYWGLNRSKDFRLEKHGRDNGNPSDSCGSSSGYETDLGETTDEEVLPPTTVNRPQALLRLHSSSSIHHRAAPTPVSTPVCKTPPSTNTKRSGPSMGSWIADPTKPIAVIDSTGKHMVIIPAQRPTRRITTTLTSPLSSTSTSPCTSFAALADAFDGSEQDPNELSSQERSITMLPSATNLMMPGLLHGAPGMEHILGGQVLGPPEAFYSFKSFDASGNMLDDDEADDFSSVDDDNDGENLLNLHDFIDFGDSSSASDNDNEKPIEESSDVTTRPPTPIAPYTDTSRAISRPTLQNSTSTTLLSHLDRGVVSSFRRNQTRHQNLLRRPPINSSLYGIKGGRHPVANSTINPIRKRKVGRILGGPLGLLTGVAAKRRVGLRNHKRVKSTH